jgi:hypothetical protein
MYRHGTNTRLGCPVFDVLRLRLTLTLTLTLVLFQNRLIQQLTLVVSLGG